MQTSQARDIKRDIELLAKLMQHDEQFMEAVLHRVELAYHETAGTSLVAGWQAKLGRGAIAAAGTYRLALFRESMPPSLASSSFKLNS